MNNDQAEFDADMEHLFNLASQALAFGGGLLPLGETTIEQQVIGDIGAPA